MTILTANTATEITTIDFSGEWLDPRNTLTFLDNVGFTSAQGRTYEDVLRMAFFDGGQWRDNWCGTGIVFDPVTRAVTAGTLTGAVATDFNGTTIAQEFAVEGFAYSAVAFYNAMVSATPDDDLAFVRAIFSGDDTFNLSPAGDDVWAWTGNDTMRGNGGNDTLHGDAGNDSIDGGTGADRMSGGVGNDLYVVDSTGDVVVEAPGAGTDTVRSTVSHTLATNVENLVLAGVAAVNGSGNALANVISGNAAANVLAGGSGNDRLGGGAGNDVLSGGVGADTMLGGTGNDVYAVDNAGDVVTEAAASGTDTVRSAISVALGANVENLGLVGAAAINGTGNALANAITGNAAANVLAGGAGNDTLNGGAGNDTLGGSTGLDVFRFTTAPNAATNVDRIPTFVSADDRIELENAVFTALGATTGMLAATKFHVGAAAADASDRIVYNQATGAMYYDADGNGAGAQILFAQFTAGTVIDLNDLWVV